MNLLGDGDSWLTAKRHESMSKAVTYSRGAQQVTVNATVGRTIEQQVAEDSGVVLETRSRDFLIRSADLVLGGVTVTPMPGDLITEDGYSFEVLPAGIDPPWRYSDVERTTIRVRTKQTGVP